MESPILIMILMVALATSILAVWFINYRYQSSKLIEAHQKVWDEQKKRLEEQGLREIDIDGFYMDYCDKLMVNRGEYGACFPRR